MLATLSATTFVSEGASGIKL